MARYQGHVAVFRATVPLGTKFVFAFGTGFRRRNWCDALES